MSHSLPNEFASLLFLSWFELQPLSNGQLDSDLVWTCCKTKILNFGCQNVETNQTEVREKLTKLKVGDQFVQVRARLMLVKWVRKSKKVDIWLLLMRTSGSNFKASTPISRMNNEKIIFTQQIPHMAPLCNDPSHIKQPHRFVIRVSFSTT